MKLVIRGTPAFAGALALLVGGPSFAASVAQMNLEQMVDRSERVFVGRVISMTESRIAVGGGEVPAVTYRLQVTESFKGQFEEIKGQRFADVMMLGTLKVVKSGRHPIVDFPLLREGGEYLLMVAPAGPVGLTATMGLGQGCFTVSGRENARVVLNDVGNAGLFNNMNVGMASGVAVSYGELAALIRSIVGGAQ